MSIGNFFKSVEEGAVKVVSFVVKEMTFAEELLGANTGNLKANLVITSVEAALSAMGVPIATVETEIKTVVDALTALFNKAGIFSKSTPPTV